jgi:outer membrane protein OmpA-like peptidoglycan-associated protein
MLANSKSIRAVRFASLIVGAILATTAVASADGPSLDGVNGLLRVHSASPATPGYVGGTIYGLYAREEYTSAQSPRGRYEVVKFGGGMLSLGYAASPYVELGIRGSLESQWAINQTDSDNDANEIGISDVSLGIKTLLTPVDARRWRLGAELSVATATGNTNAPTGSWDAEGIDLGGRLALTYAHVYEDDDPSLLFHLNAGYMNRTGTFDETLWAVTAAGPTPSRSVLHGDQFLYGAGLEIPVPENWSFFAEWTGEYDMDAGADFAMNPMRVTPGFRWATQSGSIAWTNGVEISVADELSGPAWQVISGITLGGYVAPVRGRLLGVVRDAETGEPIAGARVSVRSSEDPAALTDAEGRFETKLVEGYAVIELAADAYNAKTRVIEVRGHDSVEFDFTMMKRNIFGGVRGRVRDGETGDPLFARVRVAGTEEWVETDPATGAYLLERVPEGSVELEVSARNYEDRVASTKIVAGDMTGLDVSLAEDKLATMGVLSGAVRDGKTGEALAATVTARGKTTKTTEVDPVTGLYELEIEEGTYNLSVTAPGHVAQVEPVEIVAKEASVRNFELGGLPKKMTLKGVFFDSGTATIKRESFAALEEAARFLLDNPTLAVTIEGHTDSQGSLATNLSLSQRRADSVMKFLVVNYGVEPARLKSKGAGPNDPIASNDTREGRALNRRIEFHLEEPDLN